MNSAYRQYGKRIGDIIVSLFLLIGLSWLLLIILIAYTILFQFPILFKQQRIGKNGVSFWMYKFRTLKNSDASLQERRFALGDLIRFTNADELPQLWNVLKGEMSLVGPRPLPVEYADLFSDKQNKRHSVLPGITGLAQVSGKNNLSWDEKFRLDLEYVNKVSFALDIKILIKTLILALSFKKDTSLTEEKFTG